MPTTVRFAKKDPANFFKTLNTRVDAYFSKNKIDKKGNTLMYVKTFSFFALYFIPFAIILTQSLSMWALMGLYALMGLGVSGIGLCIMHDANHGSYSRSKWLNNLLSYSTNIVGASSFTWKIQHNVKHHTYTNIYELDEDIDDKPFLRLSPHGKLKSHHRFQHIYASFLYFFATISWVIQKDFRQLIQYNREGLTRKNGFNPTKETIIMIASKLLYFGCIIILPILVGLPWYVAVGGFIVMHGLAGLLITLVFQLAHVVEGPEHSACPETGTMENTWAIHQVRTTANFCRKNPIITWFAGGLNFQIEHHLFPYICHIHYPHISDIVKETIEEFGLPYYNHQRLDKALASHFRVLKDFGQPKAGTF